MSRYESISELMAAISRRGIWASQEEVESGVEHLGLREPFGPGDLEDLVSRLRPEHQVNQRITRVARVLASKEWSDAVIGVRLSLGIPSTGVPTDEALKMHRALLETELGQRPMDVQIDGQEKRPVDQFWKELVSASRRLCTLLEINPRPLDELRESMAKGQGLTLIGVGYLLSPDLRLKAGGHEILLYSNQVDYLIGHVLWALPLDPETMEPRPSVSLALHRLEDGGGVLRALKFNEKGATAFERKHLVKTLGHMERTIHDLGLIAMARSKFWQVATWDDRWERWNQQFPDFAFQTKHALRKAFNYAVKHQDGIRARFEMRAQGPVLNK